MNYRVLVGVGVIVFAAGLPLLPACSAPDPGEITFIPRSGASNPSDENGDTTSSGSVATDGGGGTTTSSSGSTEAGATADTIFGTDAFKFNDPGESADTVNQAPHTATMEGMACVASGCHGAPVGTGAPQWTVGGTVYADANGTKLPANTQIEIRVLDANNAVVGNSFSPDADGNFWLDDMSTTLPEGSHVAIRTATAEVKMNGALTAANNGANCSNTAGGCHGSATFRIHIP